MRDYPDGKTTLLVPVDTGIRLKYHIMRTMNAVYVYR